MCVQRIWVWNGCKNILGVKSVYKYSRCPVGLKQYYVSNGCKNHLGVKCV